jgi:hypothetical protein
MNAVALTATVVSPFGDMDVLCQQEGPLFIWEYVGQGRCADIAPAASVEIAKKVIY